MFDRETDLVDVLVGQIPVLWEDTIRWETEVRVKYGSTTTDLVVETPDALIAVEAKLRDWQQAVAQAFRNTLSFDYSFMAFPAVFTSPTMDKIAADAARWNLGVVVVRPGRCEMAIPAPRLCPSSHARDRVLQRLRKRPKQ